MVNHEQQPPSQTCLADNVRYTWQRSRQIGLVNLFLGLCLRRSFSRAGVIWVRPGWSFPRIINQGGHVEVGNCGFFPGVRIECWKGVTIKIGKGTYLNRNVEVVAAQSVIIGRDCKIAPDVLIMNIDQHPIDSTGLVNKPVHIGDRVWVGSRAIVLKGVTIGSDSIIGAGAIVTKSVPLSSVVVGPAAKVVRNLAEASPDVRAGALSRKKSEA